MNQRFFPIVVAATLLLLAGCSRSTPAPPEVVVFVATDRVISDPILQAFEAKTGIHVRPVYDAESAKTTGLVNRLLARKANPECDVLWNNEIVQTEQLSQAGLLQEYDSPNAPRFSSSFRDPRHRWTAFAGRMRLLIYNTQRVAPEAAPKGLADFTNPRWRGQAAIARPYFGTTFTHVLVLNQRWGPDRLGQFLTALRDNDVALTPGNGAVRDMVATGERTFGLTDTDDVREAVLAGKPVAFVVPDAADGPLLIPNTAAMIASCPHPAQARLLIDYLLSADVERALAEGPGAQIPLGTDLSAMHTPWDDFRKMVPMTYDISGAAAAREDVVKLLDQTAMDR